jgi:hypothetical protein
MIDAAGGWAHRVPGEQVAEWEARKFDLLRRIAEHNASGADCTVVRTGSKGRAKIGDAYQVLRWYASEHRSGGWRRARSTYAAAC